MDKSLNEWVHEWKCLHTRKLINEWTYEYHAVKKKNNFYSDAVDKQISEK